jgi:hypothetical protein
VHLFFVLQHAHRCVSHSLRQLQWLLTPRNFGLGFDFAFGFAVGGGIGIDDDDEDRAPGAETNSSLLIGEGR